MRPGLVRLIRSLILGAVLILGAAFLFAPEGNANPDPRILAQDYMALQDERLNELGAARDLTVFLRIVKSQGGTDKDGVLEAFVENQDGEFVLFKSWDICTWSGTLGPKIQEGDGQSPEGFYFVKPAQMNPNSSYHLSFNLGFPNRFDREHGRTGSFLMVHGNCVSIGCYAMTDAGIEEIYTLMTRAFDRGQPFIRVHIYPFPMTSENISLHSDNSNFDFWRNLKTGWDWFEGNARPPDVSVYRKKYVFSKS